MIPVFKHIICLLLLLADRMVFSAPKKKSGVVLVRLDAIGDFVVWSHTAKEYPKHYPSEKLVLIANSLWADLARKMNYWDEVWPVEVEKFNKDLFYRWRTMRQVSRAGFRIAIQPTYSRFLLKGDSIVRATCALQRIGYAGDTANMTKERKIIADRWFTHLIPSSSQIGTELERNTEFVNQLFDSSLHPELQILPVFPVRRQDWHEKIEKDYFIIFPGASNIIRQWPTGNFALVSDRVSRQFNWQPLICGAANERQLCQELADAMKVKGINLAGETSLPEFAELVRGAKLLIGNETSAIHIAAAVNTPSVCITGGGHYGRFVPYPLAAKGVLPVVASREMPCFYCNWQCTEPHHASRAVPCVENVSVDIVMKSAKQALGDNVYAG